MNPTGRWRGRLVVLEGIDGSGKSTLARRLVRRWRARGLRAVALREPADPGLGALGAEASETQPWMAALWFTIDRGRARGRVERALAEADVVVQDRSFYSTLAYQGSLLPPTARARIARLQSVVARPPDLVVLLDLPVDRALARLEGRSSARAPLERRRILDRVARAYRRLARGPGWQVVDADRDPAEIVDEVDRRVGALLGRRRPRTGERNLSHRRRRPR